MGALQGDGARAAAPPDPGPSQGGGRGPRKLAQHSRPEAASHTEAARRGLGATDRLETEGGWPRGPGSSAARGTAHLLHPPLPSPWNGGWVEGLGRGRPPLQDARSLGDPSQGRGHRRLSPLLTLRPLRWTRDTARLQNSCRCQAPSRKRPQLPEDKNLPGSTTRAVLRSSEPRAAGGGSSGTSGRRQERVLGASPPSTALGSATPPLQRSLRSESRNDPNSSHRFKTRQGPPPQLLCRLSRSHELPPPQAAT